MSCLSRRLKIEHPYRVLNGLKMNRADARIRCDIAGKFTLPCFCLGLFALLLGRFDLSGVLRFEQFNGLFDSSSCDEQNRRCGQRQNTRCDVPAREDPVASVRHDMHRGI